MISGFLLTRQWRDTSDGIQIECWLATDQGPMRLLVPDQTSVCFVRRNDLPKLKSILADFPNSYYKTSNLLNHYGESVVAVYSQQYRKQRELCQRIQSGGLHVWEQDIKPSDRFFMERFIRASVVVDASPNDKQTLITTRVKASDYQPKLRVLSLDIETSMDAGELYSVAAYTQDSAIVFMVSHSYIDHPDDITIVSCKSTKHCLESFLVWFDNSDPDVIIGWHVVQFDLKVLHQLCQRWNVKFTLGRGRQLPHWREDGDKSAHYYIQVPGRVILDGIELLRMAFYQFESFSLQHIASELLGDSKLIESDQRGEAIAEYFYKDKLKLAQYNLHDCVLVWKIFEHTKLLDFARARAELTGMAMDRVGGAVASFDYAYLPRLHRAGYVAPNLGELHSSIFSPGGYVLRSIPGIYRHVLVLDFKSLYPSIIRTFSIDPYSFWLAKHRQLPSEQVISGFNGASFARESSILPSIIEALWQARDQAKQEGNSPLSQAIKIIMNSFYGVLGSSGCRFYDPRVCSSITLRGHEIIQRSRDWIQEQGHQVIYGDTDSLFVWLGNDCGAQRANNLGKQLATDLNDWWSQTLQHELSIKSRLEIEFETHYSHFFMPTIRGSTKGSKKRYAGIIQGKSSKTELVFKGLETVRTDWTQLAKDFQQVLYQKIFYKEPYQDYIRKTVDALLAGQSDDQLIYGKRLRRDLHHYEKSNPPHVNAARKLKQFMGKGLRRGDRVYYVMTTNGPEPLEGLRSPIDYQHYIDKQLKPIADSILVFVTDEFEKVVQSQLSLL